MMEWEQQNKSTASYQKDLELKFRTLVILSEKFPFDTLYIVEVLRKDNYTYSNYETMTPTNKKKYKNQANKLILACLFVKNYKQ